VSALLRLFSPAYRHALKAEAEGRYIEAARAFALCGQRRKVAEMHLLEAEKRGTAASALRELQVAAHFLGADEHADQELLRRVGHAYLRSLQKGVLSAADRELCHEAAELLLRSGDAKAAAAAYELGGDSERAATMYQQAGEVEKVEALLGAQEQQRRRAHAEREHFEAYRTHLELGQRDEALAALKACLASVAIADRAEPLRLYEELKAHLLTSGVVRLRSTAALGAGQAGAESADGAARVQVFAGALPLRIGREPGCGLPLRDPGVSREHAQLELTDDGSFALRELLAKNGTLLGGLPLHPGSCLPLRDRGEIGIGQHVTLRFQVVEQELQLELLRGLERGLQLHVAPRPLALVLDGGQRLAELHFVKGRPLLRVLAGAPWTLNGRRVPPQVQLVRGDLIELAGQRIEVL
jgi:pSer/pThr/pTyr-binding forkhead associated (FHA) protein